MNEALASMETQACASPASFWVPQFLHLKMVLQDEMNQEGADHQRLCVHNGTALHSGGHLSRPKHPIQQTPQRMPEPADSTKPYLYCVIIHKFLR